MYHYCSTVVLYRVELVVPGTTIIVVAVVVVMVPGTGTGTAVPVLVGII